HRLEELLAVPGQRAARPVICRHLVPDWWSVAERYDGVHLSWAGLVTAEGCVTDLGGGEVALMRYWFSERAHWLADVFGEPRPLPGPVLDRPAPRSTPGRSRTALDPSHVLARLLGRGGAP